MEFCPTCGTMLASRKEEGGKAVLRLLCPRCGYEKQADRPLVSLSRIVEHTPQERIVVIGKQEQRLRTLPKVRVECPKCGNNLAYAWQVQTREIDQSITQFFRCTKCNYTFREYN